MLHCKWPLTFTVAHVPKPRQVVKFTWNVKLRPAFLGEESTVYCQSTFRTHTRENRTPCWVRVERFIWTVDANSTTIVGPRVEMPHDNAISESPFFCPGADHFELHKRVWRWVSLLKTAQDKGSDGSFHKNFKILSHSLYTRELPCEQHSIADVAQSKQFIANMYTTDPDEVALDVVSTVPVDSPIDKVLSLISSFNKFISCRESMSEDTSGFVSRSRGLAATHLEYTNTSSSSQVGQDFSITLLTSASVDKSTLMQCKLQLISLAESRMEQSIENISIQADKAKADSL